jgi:hypothetical protein
LSTVLSHSGVLSGALVSKMIDAEFLTRVPDARVLRFALKAT